MNQPIHATAFDQAARSLIDGREPSPVRLLLWSPNGAGLHYNGPGMSAYRLLTTLRAADPLTVTLAHGSRCQARYDIFADQHFISPVANSIASQALFIWRGCRWLSRQRSCFDVLYGLQAFDFTVEPASFAERLGIPSVVKVVQHRADLADRTGWRSLLGRSAARRKKVACLSGIVAISDAIFHELIEYGIPERKIARIPNGVDTERFQPPACLRAQETARAELGWVNEPTILFTGAVTPRKRPHLLVEALGRLRASGITARLVIAGPVKDLKYGHRMEQLAADLGIADRVLWTGFITDPAPLYRAADVFSLPSSNEGLPNALLEAMASGLPSVITPVPGASDLARHGEEAIVVEPTASAVAEAFKLYLASPKLRQEHGAAARRRASQKFSARHILECHIRLFQRVMQGEDAAG